MRTRIRRLWMLALLLLGSNLLLGCTFWFVLVVHSVHRDPQFSHQLQEIQQAYYPDSNALTEASQQRYFEALQPVFAHVDWFQVALISSVLGFGGLGLLAARLRLDPLWMGALPLATMLSGPNPAVLPTLLENQGLPGHHLELPQQLAVFGLQTVVLYLVAYLTSKPPRSP